MHGDRERDDLEDVTTEGPLAADDDIEVVAGMWRLEALRRRERAESEAPGRWPSSWRP